MQAQEKFMKEALKEAKKAYKKLEVPVGAVIVKNGEIIDADPNVISSGIFGFIGTGLIYKLRKNENNKEIDVLDLFRQIDKSFIIKLAKV